MRVSSDTFTSATFDNVKTAEPMLVRLPTSRKLGLVTLNLVIQTEDDGIKESRKGQKRPSCRREERLPLTELSLKRNLRTRKQVLTEFS